MPPPNRAPQEAPQNDWLDRLARFNAHFGRFLRDVGGVVLLALAAMSLMALWGVTGGILLTPWATFLELWMGWGSHLFILALALGGIFLLRRDGRPIHFGWIISFELASFLTLGLLAVFGGLDLARAELGMDGGRLGWGLARFFITLAGPTWGVVLLASLWLFFTLGAFNVWALVETRLHYLAETEPSLSSPDEAEE